MSNSDNSSSSSEKGSEDSFFSGLILKLVDKSKWIINESISNPKYQHRHAPCEAIQVFACTCIEDPFGTYADAPEAVVKVRYQYVLTVSSVAVADGYRIRMSPQEREMWVCQWNDMKNMIYDRCSCKSEPQRCTRCQEAREYYAELFYAGENPVEYTNKDTEKEMRALELLRKAQCPYTPWLIGVRKQILELEEDGPALDEHAIVGGYSVFIVMTKVPGEPLSKIFTHMPKAKRDEVREGFKEAWT